MTKSVKGKTCKQQKPKKSARVKGYPCGGMVKKSRGK